MYILAGIHATSHFGSSFTCLGYHNPSGFEGKTNSRIPTLRPHQKAGRFSRRTV
jgi:hypothetical protein